MSIRNNSAKMEQAAALEAKVQAFVTSGGRITHSRAKGGPTNKYTENLVVYSQREAAVIAKQRMTWAAALEQLRAMGKLTPNVEALIKAKL